jgi:hypothetical protein
VWWLLWSLHQYTPSPTSIIQQPPQSNISNLNSVMYHSFVVASFPLLLQFPIIPLLEPAKYRQVKHSYSMVSGRMNLYAAINCSACLCEWYISSSCTTDHARLLSTTADGQVFPSLHSSYLLIQPRS